MKAIVKATGEIVELDPYGEVYEKQKEPFKSKKHKICHLEGIEIFDEPDYWTRLEHQYAGMAMQGLMSILPQIGGIEGRSKQTEVIDIATSVAHALVEKMKEEK